MYAYYLIKYNAKKLKSLNWKAMGKWFIIQIQGDGSSPIMKIQQYYQLDLEFIAFM